MVSANNLSFVDIPVFNALIPKEGPKALLFALDFSAATTYEINLLLQQQRQQISMVQTLFIDNSLNGSTTQVAVRGTSQLITIGPKSQGFFPVLCPQPPTFDVSSVGAVVVGITCVNVPVPACVWSTLQSGFVPNGAGAIVVSDTALDATIAGNRVGTQNGVTGDADTPYPEFLGSKLFTGTVTVIGPTNIIVGNPGWFFSRAEILLSGDAALAAAGELTVTLLDNATVIATGVAVLPNAASAGALAPMRLIDLTNLQYNGKTANTNLRIQLSVALTAGKVYFNVAGGVTATVG